MFKSVKECLKNWLITHERLYWYIVVGLAVFGFGLITALGCAKLEKANAAETTDGVYYPAVNVVDWGEYFNEVKTAITGCDLFWVACRDGQYVYGFIDSDTYSGDAYYVWTSTSGYLLCANYYFVVDELSMSAVEYWSGNPGQYEIATFAESYLVGTNYSFSKTISSPALKSKNLNYPALPAEYTDSAPYVTFKNLNVRNDIADDKGSFSDAIDFYDNLIKTAYWEYVGHIENYDEYRGSTFQLTVDFTAELPQVSYITSLADKFDIDLSGNLAMFNFVKDGHYMIDIWNADAAALKHTYEFTSVVDIVPDDNGNFSFRLPFDDIELLIKYFNPSALDLYNGCDSNTMTIIMSFLHIDSCCITAKTTTSDSVLYGISTINIFERGVYDACVEVEVDEDLLSSSGEDLDQKIQDAIAKGYEDYYKELEDKVDSLENQLADISSVQAGFGGELSGTDLWNGFTSLADGLGSLAPSIYAVSSLTGSCLAFLPFQVSSVLSFTMLAICIVAIIKAIRG